MGQGEQRTHTLPHLCMCAEHGTGASKIFGKKLDKFYKKV